MTGRTQRQCPIGGTCCETSGKRQPGARFLCETDFRHRLQYPSSLRLPEGSVGGLTISTSNHTVRRIQQERWCISTCTPLSVLSREDVYLHRLKVLQSIRTLTDSQLELCLPKIVVVGDQSSGKRARKLIDD